MLELAELTTALLAADDPLAALPDPLPVPVLELQIALHGEVTAAMRSDLARARRAAAAVWALAEYAPADPLLRAQAHWSMGSAVLFVPLYGEALAHYDAALVAYAQACAAYAPALPPRDVRVVHAVRIFCLNELGRYREALEAAALAEAWLAEQPDPAVRLTYLINRSLLAGNMGDYAQMLSLADATISLAEQQASRARAAMGWINRAYACLYLGRLAEAEAALQTGLALAEAAGEALTVARAQLNLATLRRYQGHLAEALALIHKAELGLQQSEGEAATVALELAQLYEQLRQLEDAERSAVAAAAHYAEQQMPLYSAQAYLHAARIAIQRGRGAHAQALLARAQAQAACLSLATLEAELTVVRAQAAALPPAPGTPAPARRAARSALDAALVTLAAAGLAREAAEATLAAATLDARSGRRRQARVAYASLREHASLEFRLAAAAGLGALLPLQQALPHLRAAAELAVLRRRTLPAEELQARYSSETALHHMRLTQALLELGALPDALECVWDAKAGPLIDLRAAGAVIAPETQAQLNAAKADLARQRASEHEHLAKAADAAGQGQSERAAYHHARAAAATRAVVTSEQHLTEAARRFAARMGHMALPRLAAVRARLQPGQSLVEYVRLETRLVAFVLACDQPPQLFELGPFEASVQLIQRWKLVQHGIRNQQRSAAYLARHALALAALRAQLLDPLEAALAAATTLLIAPDAQLHQLPWAALCAQTPARPGWPPPLLIPGGALCAAPTTLAGPLGPPRILGYANEGRRHLSGVAIEVAAVARALPDALVRLDATSDDVRAEPPPRLLHIAAHGLTRPQTPACSSLELRDGPLLLIEAHRLNLRGTRLVTLSACATGERPDYGELSLAMAGAFLSAGAETVLASLWPVDDQATTALMSVFYAQLALGATLGAALYAAQQALRADFPADWAAFQLWSSTAQPHADLTEKDLRPSLSVLR